MVRSLQDIAANPSDADDKIKLAVYDFDGTSIRGNSPVLLVRHLITHGMLTPKNALSVGIWALKYKLQLPQDERHARALVFTAFKGKPKHVVDQYLYDFYDREIEHRFRRDAESSMLNHRAQGHYVLVVSASFEAIIDRAQEKHPFDHGISTCMAVDDQGNYTNEVDGAPVEGEQKVRAVEKFANEAFGTGRWEIAFAYGDHHSDSALLDCAQTAYAVDPDNPLTRMAKDKGWTILNWK